MLCTSAGELDISFFSCSITACYVSLGKIAAISPAAYVQVGLPTHSGLADTHCLTRPRSEEFSVDDDHKIATCERVSARQLRTNHDCAGFYGAPCRLIINNDRCDSLAYNYDDSTNCCVVHS